MDIAYFSKLRTDFIRMYYRESHKPFNDLKAAIEAKEPPFDEPPDRYNWEGDEPPYLTEWLEAEMALNVLGYSCLSMLSNSLKLAFQNMENVFGFQPTEEERKLFKDGFVNGYKHVLTEILNTDWSDCPADFAIIEQVVLARNITQHLVDYSGFDAYHDEKTVKKHPRLFFVSGNKTELELEYDAPWFSRRIEVTEADLFKAIDEVEKLIEYIMSRENKAREWRVRRRQENMFERSDPPS
ncbi:hypothetical protein [Rhizobium leguminosarum]|uniref:hypothetical protein n=1 Tax=Rhizobium leguminosarum TaxID=384 RepID=UPI001C95D55F|nr:hypothetical protein [Rhizobium leguminosarum]MBY5405906.1 hypothetical protein [Rhizobium leguminosarum]